MENLCEKNRPQSWDEIVGQDHIIEALKYQQENRKPHMLFLGPPGCGKTTTALVYAKENNLPIIEMNASDSRKIENVRGEIKRISKSKGRRVLVLDEFDNMTPDAQQALRSTMEKTKSTVFILCGNYGHKIIEPIKSRCTDYPFKRLDDKVVLKKVLEICKKENIIVEKESRSGFVQLITQTRGDLRKAIGILEKIVGEGKKITEKSVLAFQRPNIAKEVLFSALDGNFEKAQRTLEDAFISSRMDANDIARDFFDALPEVKNKQVRIKLYRELSITARALRIENDPLIQLTGFIAYAFIVPHLSSECPVLKGEE